MIDLVIRGVVCRSRWRHCQSIDLYLLDHLQLPVNIMQIPSKRPSRGRGEQSTKGYICVFICVSTKATYIEIVSDFTTNTFLGAFDRITNRRGLTNSIISNNGTTFVGAERKIAKLFQEKSPFFKVVRTPGCSRHHMIHTLAANGRRRLSLLSFIIN